MSGNTSRGRCVPIAIIKHDYFNNIKCIESQNASFILVSNSIGPVATVCLLPYPASLRYTILKVDYFIDSIECVENRNMFVIVSSCRFGSVAVMHLLSCRASSWTAIIKTWNDNTRQLSCGGLLNNTKMPISYPKSDLHDINALTSFGENPLIFTKVIVRKWKHGRTYARRTDGRTVTWTTNVKP